MERLNPWLTQTELPITRRRRIEWDEHVTRMDSERLVIISGTIYLPEDLQGFRKEDGAT